MDSVVDEQRAWLTELLDALRYGTKREDVELVERLLAQHELERGDDLVERILAGPGFETFFLDAFREIQPFALMLSGLYRFLSSSAATVDADARRFRVTAEGADVTFDFPLDGFPRVLQEVLGTFNARQNDVQLTCVAHPRTDQAEDDAWQACDPQWDFDFYDYYREQGGFCRLASYAPTFIQRGTDAQRTECEALLGPIMNLLRALCEPLVWPELPRTRSAEAISTCWINGELETVRLQLVPSVGFRLDRATTVAAFERTAGDDDDGVPTLSGPTDTSVWRRREWQLIGWAHLLRLWDQQLPRNDNRDELADLMGRPFDEISVDAYLGRLRPLAERFETALHDLVTVVGTRSIEVTARAVVEFVALPFWRDRAFLYELWTLSHVLQGAARVCPLELHGIKRDADGAVVWAIPGRDDEATTPVASVGGRVDVWAAHSTRVDERAPIKPDIRLTRTSDGHDLVLVECKDRRAPRRSDMADVLDRYVAGSPAEVICLVNADRFSPATLGLGGAVDGREVIVVDRYCPPSPSPTVSARIVEIIERETAPPKVEPGPGSESDATAAIAPGAELTVTLTWTGATADLDLHGWVTSANGTTAHVSWQHREHDRPFATLSSDEMRSPGREVLLVDVGSAAEVVLAVHRYDGGALRAAEPMVEISGPGVDVRRSPTTGGDGDWWHLGTYVSGAREFVAVDRIGAAAPVA